MGSLILSLWAVVASGTWLPRFPPAAVAFVWKEGEETRWELWRLDQPRPQVASGWSPSEVEAATRMHAVCCSLELDGPTLVVRHRPEVARA